MPSLNARFRAWTDRHFLAISSTLLVALLLFFFFFNRMVITIPAGHGGALWLRFFGGTVVNDHYDEGTKVIFPWDKIYIYDVRVQQETSRFDFLTREGLQISGEVTIRFRLQPEALGAITAYAGPGFVASLVMPTVAAAARQEAANYTLEEVYSTRRREIESIILKNINDAVKHLIPDELHLGREVLVEDFSFRSIVLPDRLQVAIEGKLTQAQYAQQYAFILQREEQERQRKIVEAQGIKAFQDIVSSGISENYLRWKGIDATLKLAESPNAKMVIIGGKEGLPVILGPLDSSSSSTTPATSAQPPLPRVGAVPPAAPGAPSSAAAGSSGGTPSSSGVREPPSMPAAPTASDPRLSMPPASLQR